MDQRHVMTLDEVWKTEVPTRAHCTPEELLSKAEKELNEVAAERSDKIQAFREAVSCVPGLKSRTDDSFLLRFLRARKFDQKKALDLLKNYYRQPSKYPELYRNLLASSIPHVLGEPLYGALPHKDSQGRTLLLYNAAGIWNPSTVPLDDLLRNMLITLEKVIEQEETQICGVAILMNTKDFGFKHYLSYTPMKFAKMLSVTFNSFPIRFKELHVINESAFVRWSYYIVRPFLSQKMKERFIFHGTNLDSLHERFPQEILPEEFGGLLGPFSNSGWNKLLLENDVSLERNTMYGYNLDID